MRLDESPAARIGLDQRPKGVDLANIVDQSEPRTRPLYIHFIFGAEGEAVHALVNANIGQRPLRGV